MRLFKSGKIYDFMAVRWYWIGLSLFITFGAAILLLMGKAKLGTEFKLQLRTSGYPEEFVDELTTRLLMSLSAK